MCCPILLIYREESSTTINSSVVDNLLVSSRETQFVDDGKNINPTQKSIALLKYL